MSTNLEDQSSQVIAQKRNSWANMGEAVYIAELKLQAMQQQAVAEYCLPTSIKEVGESEEKLKLLKQNQKQIETKRKEITSKFDELISRLMQPEKALIEPISELQSAIIKIKKEEEKRLADLKIKTDEIVRFKEFVSKKSAEICAEKERFILEKIHAAYDYAINKENLLPDDLSDYILRVKTKVNINSFVVEIRDWQGFQSLSEIEKDEIIKENFNYDSGFFKEKFDTLLQEKFSDYAVAFANKELAFEKAKKELEEANKKIEDDRLKSELAASLSSIAAQQVILTNDIRPLKETYEVDMPETVDTAVYLMAAFISNKNLLMDKLRVTKWFSFSPLQISAALAKCKNDDEKFCPQNIKFKIVDKL